MSVEKEDTIVIVGGGLAGALGALMLGNRGFNVHLYEGREDWRVDESKALNRGEDQSRSAIKRSINLALSHRGRKALAQVGLESKVMEQAIPMRCRAIHSTMADGDPDALQPYDEIDASNAIYSVNREHLNNLLLTEAEKIPTVKVFFGMKLTHIHPNGTVHFRNVAENKPTSSPATYNDYEPGDTQINPRLVIGADGAYSSTREAMLRLQPMNFKRQYISHGYKELTIPPNVNGEFAMATPEALHIWPRGDFMMIGLPNADKTFTCTLFAPFTSEIDKTTGKVIPGMLDQQTPEEIKAYFTEHFPDAIPLMPDFVAEYMRNPACQLVTVRARPWNFKDQIILVGDAAHAMVPFYGQGMNAAFEDVMTLVETIDRFDNDIAKAVPYFASHRRDDGESIAKLSMQNYLEMRHHSGSALFRMRKKFEGVLNWMFPNKWIPLYKMVAFTSIPYSQAIRRADRQDRSLQRGAAALSASVCCALCGTVAWKVLSATPTGLDMTSQLAGGVSTTRVAVGLTAAVAGMSSVITYMWLN